jgi:hypothetical protein
MLGAGFEPTIPLFELFKYVKPVYRPMSAVFIRVKVKLSLCLAKHHAMKAYWASGGITPRIL